MRLTRSAKERSIECAIQFQHTELFSLCHSFLSSADTLQWAARSSPPRRVMTILWEEEEKSGSASISPFDPPCGR